MRARTVLFWSLTLGMLAPAAVLTAARLVDSESGSVIRLQSFTPYALALYGASLMLLAPAAIRRTKEQTVLLVPALVALGGLLLHGWWFAPQVVGGRPEAARGADPLTVMTANLAAGRGDAADVVRQAADAEVDLLVVTEITERALGDMDRAGLEDLLPHRAGQPGQGFEGTMVFAGAPAELVDDLGTVFGSIVVETAGLTVLAAHPRPPTRTEAWLADHAVVLAAAEDVDPDLIVGDLNAAPDHAPMRDLGDAGFRDSVEVVNDVLEPTWPANGDFPVLGWFPPSVPIDHVLVGPTMTVLETHTVDLGGTDHRPVVATVAARA